MYVRLEYQQNHKRRRTGFSDNSRSRIGVVLVHISCNPCNGYQRIVTRRIKMPVRALSAVITSPSKIPSTC